MPQPNLNSADYYEILGCSRDANDAALKKAYRKLAVKWHPDKNPDNDEATTNFQKISEAYATLSDSEKRKLYDQYGKQGADAADHMPDGTGSPGFGFGGAGGFPPGAHFQGGMSPEDANRVFSEFFGSSDPFGGFGGGVNSMFHEGANMNGMPGVSFSSSMGGMPMGGMPMGGMPMGVMPMSFGAGGGGMDPSSMMFNGGGMPGGFVSSSAQHQSYTEQYDIIPCGTAVSLKGLINAPEQNGDRGVIKGYNTQTGRYVIELTEDEDVAEDEKEKKTMSVKASNLLQHIQVQVHDLQNQAELNGTTGTIITWIPSKKRYNIYISSLKKFISIRPGNVIFVNKTVAQIVGLQSKPELNGTFGTIKEWIKETNKYDIQLSAQQVIRVKAENIRL